MAARRFPRLKSGWADNAEDSVRAFERGVVKQVAEWRRGSNSAGETKQENENDHR